MDAEGFFLFIFWSFLYISKNGTEIVCFDWDISSPLAISGMVFSLGFVSLALPDILGPIITCPLPRPVTPDEVTEIIAGLKNTKSTGMDFIDTWVVKLIAREIVPALTHIVNLSILKAEFPNPWKISKVVPLLKKGDPLLTQNYRPVALLPIFSKILERAVFLQLVNYLESNELLNPNHHGCRQGHNTATALLQMCDQWLEEVDSNLMVGVMLVDLPAAFDMVDHSILLKKLELYGMDHQSISWMNSYLSRRSQVVMVDGWLSLTITQHYLWCPAGKYPWASSIHNIYQ